MKNPTTRRMKPRISEEDAVRHSESEDDDDDFIFKVQFLKCACLLEAINYILSMLYVFIYVYVMIK